MTILIILIGGVTIGIIWLIISAKNDIEAAKDRKQMIDDKINKIHDLNPTKTITDDYRERFRLVIDEHAKKMYYFTAESERILSFDDII